MTGRERFRAAFDPAGTKEFGVVAAYESLILRKKGFTIDIAEVARRVDGRCVIFGNLDAIDVLEGGSDEELRSEIARQLGAGHRNGNRFVMSTGSPVTPGTPLERVRRYTDLVRELAGGRAGAE